MAFLFSKISRKERFFKYFKSKKGPYPWNQPLPGEPLLPGKLPPRWERRLTNDGAFEGCIMN